MPKNDAPSYSASLFQKAHDQIVTMQKIDSQIADLLSQRRAAQGLLGETQEQINNEFGRLMRESDELPAKILAEISGGNGGHGGTGAPAAPEAQPRTKITEPVA